MTPVPNVEATMKRSGLTITCMLLLLLLVSGRVSAETHQELVENYIDLSGMGEMLRSLPTEMDALASQRSLTSRHPDVESRVYRMVRESFDVRKAKQSLSAYLLHHTDTSYVEDILRWLNTPLARKITREELSASASGQQANMLHYLADLQATPPPQRRIALVQEVERVTHLSELTTRIVMEVTRGMMESINLALPEGDREPLDDNLEEMETMGPVIREGFRQQMILTSFYAYRNISDKELADYIGFYDSDLGRREIRITGDALGHVLREWFAEFGRRLAAAAKDESGKTGQTPQDPTPKESTPF
ncbi:DUF2059 domain-containing protein [Pelobacter propionicus]|nr:DUF2059 domain-containing protein [Pelobacter propionicus]